MAYLFTGVQHLKTGDVIIPMLEFNTIDDYKKKYHEEMSYAMSNDDFLGLGIKVFDEITLMDVLIDRWSRQS